MEFAYEVWIMRLTLTEVKQRVSKLVPEDIDYEVEVEAGSIAIITKQPEAFGGGRSFINRKNCKKCKAKSNRKTHPDILADEAAVRQKVNEIIPSEAEVRNVWLDPALSEVTLECDDPASAVGPKGINIKNLRDEIGWLVSVERAPAFESRTQHDIRRYRKELADEKEITIEEIWN